MAYRPALHPPRGSWGRFLDQMRRERAWSAVQAHEALHGVLHLSIKSVAVYKAIESGVRTVRPEEADALREYFGRGPEDVPIAEAVADPLVAAINALVAELCAWREEDRAKLERLGATVGLMAERVLGPQGTQVLARPGAPGETAG